MEKSDSIAKLAEALSSAQAQMKHAQKDGINPHFKSKFATFGSVVNAIKIPLSDHGLSYTQLCDIADNGGLIVETMLMHVSGEFIKGRMNMPVQKQDPQGFGAALTYAKRYSLAACVGLVTDDDSDAEEAMKRDIKEKPIPEIDSSVIDSLMGAGTLEALAAAWSTIPTKDRVQYTKIKDDAKAALQAVK
jgi:hypothetical protein